MNEWRKQISKNIDVVLANSQFVCMITYSTLINIEVHNQCLIELIQDKLGYNWVTRKNKMYRDYLEKLGLNPFKDMDDPVSLNYRNKHEATEGMEKY